MTELQYSTVISPNDHMWNTGPQWYFDVGKSALDCIKSALATTHTTPTSILDFPCGHGRVCRMLRALFPDTDLTVCDLDRDGVDFCAAQFNATPFYSHEDIRCVNLDRCFDLIWCGSLFTHLDAQQWPDFLGFFAEHLAPDGVLVFTTHGRRPIQWMREGVFGYGLNNEEQRRLIEGYVRAGFGFVSPSNQAFGISLSSRVLFAGSSKGYHRSGSSAFMKLDGPATRMSCPASGCECHGQIWMRSIRSEGSVEPSSAIIAVGSKERRKPVLSQDEWFSAVCESYLNL